MIKRTAMKKADALKRTPQEIFSQLFIVFLVSTILLMSNADKKNLEKELMRILISEGVTDGINLSDAPQYIIVSAKQTESGVQYYVNKKPIVIEKLKDVLIHHRQKGVSVIITEYDKRLPHGNYISILDTAKQCGITDFFDAYTKKGGIS